MALAEQVKKGGPYTKKEQDSRRQEVFRLHFEKGYSAVKISEMLNVNRNTINEDIRYWYSQLAQEFSSYDVISWTLEQFHRLESQRNRLVEELEKQQDIRYKLAIEKLIFQIDNKLSQFVSKIISSNIAGENIKNNQEVIDKTKEIVRYLLQEKNLGTSDRWTEKELLYQIIKRFKCDLTFANTVFNNMKRLGLEVCKRVEPFDTEMKYDLVLFAYMCGFISEKECYCIRKIIDNNFEESTWKPPDLGN